MVDSKFYVFIHCFISKRITKIVNTLNLLFSLDITITSFKICAAIFAPGMEFHVENGQFRIHNTNHNLLTLEITFDEEKEIKKPMNIPLLYPPPPSVISDVSQRTNIHVEVEHPFSQHFKFDHRFLVKYLLSLLYNKTVHLKVICFDEELKFDIFFETLRELLKRIDGTQVELFCDDTSKRIVIAGKVVYETKIFF
ncbi:hypothetical protein THOM_2009 [Trachipleistophora hominis]|uniref:Uncharacterized protein n=1 Tax=Trachipleistophora hominis TaxID=72359 RepID=L7JUD2_TRAHO|nr:hypothetical protein THOM_2009 [Trachipleistophora hominis]